MNSQIRLIGGLAAIAVIVAVLGIILIPKPGRRERARASADAQLDTHCERQSEPNTESDVESDAILVTIGHQPGPALRSDYLSDRHARGWDVLICRRLNRAPGKSHLHHSGWVDDQRGVHQ